MWISELHLSNIRGFVDSGQIKFSKGINIFIGPNNSGKSTILNSVLLFQRRVFEQSDITLKIPAGKISITFEDFKQYFPEPLAQQIQKGIFKNNLYLDLSRDGTYKKYIVGLLPSSRRQEFNEIPSVEPYNLIYPYLSKRKVNGYSEIINSQTSNSVTGNFENLYAKIDRLSNPYFLPGFTEYQDACIKILGFPVSTIASDRGKQAALIVKNMDHIPLTSMGEGVANLLGLIVDLCMAESKIFLIEEPENDIHPKALKSLLELIERKSDNNQFFISTHSNIVTKYLGGLVKSKVFKVNMSFADNTFMPITAVREISNDKAERQQVLEELGYEFHDYDLWKAWLFLEESSAEIIIRDYLIPLFVPSLRKILRSFSSRSITEAEIKFKDFNNLFVFLHLEPVYKNKAWVVLDNGDNEKIVIEKMKSYYVKSGWNPENFIQWEKPDFEMYYPETFKERASKVLSIKNKIEKMEQKKLLLNDLIVWIESDRELARKELAISAKEIISLLKSINNQIK